MFVHSHLSVIKCFWIYDKLQGLNTFVLSNVRYEYLRAVVVDDHNRTIMVFKFLY